MSEERLERIRPCEHGEWNVHALEGTILNEDGSIDRDKVCRGAVRREITPDIDAAFQVMSGDVIGQLTEDEIREGRKLVAEAIDAALGRGDTREDDR